MRPSGSLEQKLVRKPCFVAESPGDSSNLFDELADWEEQLKPFEIELQELDP